MAATFATKMTIPRTTATVTLDPTTVLTTIPVNTPAIAPAMTLTNPAVLMNDCQRDALKALSLNTA
ncbi:putative dienelactone hydrolase [Rhizobium sp. BK529]|uniref:hypothetical protein n=1 Tax=unclassified Rhizobium TaxID=2613769 RepID=UPI001790FCD9|nr:MULTISPECIES: hypothetical protein [unclassified Rhizobium]MBB3593087.1 putative dienelactone hydrolase [Rhizobium sp. BK529]